MTKEDILRQVVPNNCYWEDNFDNVPRHYIETSMDEYAKQQAIAFAQWLGDNDYRPFDKMGKDHWLQGGMSVSRPISDLYTLFLTHQSI